MTNEKLIAQLAELTLELQKAKRWDAMMQEAIRGYINANNHLADEVEKLRQKLGMK